MKKLLSVLVTICMMLTMVILPVSAEEPAGDDTLGPYYKFTFGGDYNYNYVADHTDTDKGAKEYKGNTFYPLWSNGTSTGNPLSAEQKEITLKNGNKYNVLEINSNSKHAYFTPLTNEGKPYELTPGKTYDISVKMFVPRAVAFTKNYFVVGQNTQVAVDGDKLDNGSNQSVITPYKSAGIGNVGGAARAIHYNDGDYDETTVLARCNRTDHVTDCGRTWAGNTVYVEQTVSITVPDIYTKDANNSQSATIATTKGNEVSLNNYLTMYLQGESNIYGKWVYVNDDSVHHYGTGTKPEDDSKVPSTYQIVSIEVKEQGAVSTTFEIPEGATSNDGTIENGILTVYSRDGETVAAPEVFDAEGNLIEKWYDESGNEVTEFVAGGVYTYKSFIYGDVDGDGDVDAEDLGILKLYLVDLADAALGADCNGDGDVDAEDLGILKLYLVDLAVLGPAQ